MLVFYLEAVGLGNVNATDDAVFMENPSFSGDIILN